MAQQPIIALVGPTAVGKTEISIELAKRLDAEIVNCDSMQVYRRMAVLTQQPTPAQRKAVAHHLVDWVEPTESFNVGHYRQAALTAIQEIQRRGKTVLVVGGTGLYLRALTDGLCEAPAADPEIRRQLWTKAQEGGSPALHERLRTVDPVAAANIHPHDARRLIRALEVYALTGRPLSSWWRWKADRDRQVAASITILGVTRPRAELYERINRRVERMILQEEVLNEVRDLLGVPLSPTARQVHGLQYLASYLRGEQSLEAIIPVWQQQVRHYARRQLMWFRADPRIRWMMLSSDETTEAIAQRILGSVPFTVDSVQRTNPR